jgi:type VI secretion system protein
MADSRGLLSRLASPDPSRPIDEIQSILGNLRALLNTREGDSPAVPEFGIVDLSDLVHNFPNASQYMQRSIRDTIGLFEPRLTNVRVRSIPSEDPLKLVFEVSARLTNDRKRGLVRVRTEVLPNGRVQVQ